MRQIWQGKDYFERSVKIFALALRIEGQICPAVFEVIDGQAQPLEIYFVPQADAASAEQHILGLLQRYREKYREDSPQ